MLGDMHRPLQTRQLTRFSALAGALDQSRDHHNKENRDPGVPHIYQVPVRPLSPSQSTPGSTGERGTVVAFEPTNPAQSGWRFSDIRLGRIGEFVDPHHPALWGPRSPSGIDLVVYWPGYDGTNLAWRISLNKGGRIPSKLDVAQEIVHAFESFFEKACHKPFSYEVDPFWQIRSPYPYPLEDMVLFSLSNTHGDLSIYQAVVGVTLRR